MSDPGVIEYALEMSSGDMQVRSNHPEVEKIYPLAQWVGHHVWQGAHVWRRKVVITEEWERVCVKDLRGEARATYDKMRVRFPLRKTPDD